MRDSNQIPLYVECFIVCQSVDEGPPGLSTISGVGQQLRLKPSEKPIEEILIYGRVTSHIAGEREHEAAIRVYPPGGEPQLIPAFPIRTLTPIPGGEIRFHVEVGPQYQGIYWFELIIDGRPLTRVPLQVLNMEAEFQVE